MPYNINMMFQRTWVVDDTDELNYYISKYLYTWPDSEYEGCDVEPIIESGFMVTCYFTDPNFFYEWVGCNISLGRPEVATLQSGD
jgi:hypothetical protein